MLAPLLLSLAGCENNEKGVKVEGATTAPEAAASSDEAIKQAATVKPGRQGPATKGYPGAKGGR